MENLGKVTLTTVELLGQTITFNPLTFFWTYVIMGALIIASYIMARSFKTVPTKSQNMLEVIYDFLGDITISTLGEKDGKRHLPMILTLFIFILAANWSGLIPNIIAFLGTIIALILKLFGSVAVSVDYQSLTKIMVEVPDSHWLSMFIGFPNVQEPTKFVNTDLALALAIFLVVQYTGISSKGFVGYLRSFVDDPFPMKGFWIILFPLNIFFYLNIIGAVANVVSHSFRLFGNIFGGGMIIVIVSSLLKYMFIPIGLNAFFTIFAGLVQAFVFTMLAVTYIQQQQA